MCCLVYTLIIKGGLRLFITARKLPEELLFYRALSKRGVNETEKIKKLERGYQGELIYDKILEAVGHQHLYIFRDIYLLIEGSVTQYDTLVVSESGIIVNEIKNFKGDYRVDGTNWYTGNFTLPDDAASQLRRAVGKLERLKRHVPFDFNIGGKLVFPNEEFRLSGGDERLWAQVVLRADLRRYFTGFQNEYSGQGASHIADVIERHIVSNPYFKLRVEFESVRKGLYCGGCGSFKLEKAHFHYVCSWCGSRESNETHLVRAMSDFKYLFGGLRMTKRKMMDFTGGTVSERTLIRTMAKYCHVIGQYKSSEYKFKYYDFDEAMKKEQPYRKYKDYLK